MSRASPPSGSTTLWTWTVGASADGQRQRSTAPADRQIAAGACWPRWRPSPPARPRRPASTPGSGRREQERRTKPEPSSTSPRVSSGQSGVRRRRLATLDHGSRSPAHRSTAQATRRGLRLPARRARILRALEASSASTLRPTGGPSTVCRSGRSAPRRRKRCWMRAHPRHLRPGVAAEVEQGRCGLRLVTRCAAASSAMTNGSSSHFLRAARKAHWRAGTRRALLSWFLNHSATQQDDRAEGASGPTGRG